MDDIRCSVNNLIQINNTNYQGLLQRVREDYQSLALLVQEKEASSRLGIDPIRMPNDLLHSLAAEQRFKEIQQVKAGNLVLWYRDLVGRYEEEGNATVDYRMLLKKSLERMVKEKEKRRIIGYKDNLRYVIQFDFLVKHRVNRVEVYNHMNRLVRVVTPPFRRRDKRNEKVMTCILLKKLFKVHTTIP